MQIVLVASVAAALIGALVHRHYRFRLLGDVNADGCPVQNCNVELLRRWHPVTRWSFYIARKTITGSRGEFAFDVLSPPGGTFRLRVLHAGFQEWLLEAPTFRVPHRVHVSLLRDEAPSSEAPTTHG